MRRPRDHLSRQALLAVEHISDRRLRALEDIRLRTSPGGTYACYGRSPAEPGATITIPSFGSRRKHQVDCHLHIALAKHHLLAVRHRVFGLALLPWITKLARQVSARFEFCSQSMAATSISVATLGSDTLMVAAPMSVPPRPVSLIMSSSSSDEEEVAGLVTMWMRSEKLFPDMQSRLRCLLIAGEGLCAAKRR